MSEQIQLESRVGILGGSFNPPTIGHMQVLIFLIQMAAELLNNCLIDEVWIVPCKSNEAFTQDSVSVEHRLRMIELSVEQFFKGTGFKVKIDETEILNPEPMTTYSLMKQFIQTYPRNSFAFILGSDILPEIRNWKEGVNFADEIKIFVFERPGYPIQKEFLPVKNFCIDSVSLSSSSAEVRERINFVKQLYQTENLTPESLQEILKNKSSKCAEFSDSMLDLDRLGERIQILKRHLGVYGIVANAVIDYIRENHLY